MIDPTAPRYVLAGHCERCGDCCVNEGCDHLSIVDGLASCLIHADRPEKCRAYPGNPPIVFHRCSYGFIDLWDDGRIVEQGKS